MAENERHDTSHSPGNAGSRGSRGQPNSGAQAENASERTAEDRLRPQGTDLHGEDARGGGGASSASSRSQDDTRDDADGERE